MIPDLAEQMAAISTLSEPLRRALYLYVVAQRRPVSRAQAAGAQGIARTVAAFHLDRLVEAGLLQANRGRTTGRSGPGAGRPAVLYSRAERPHEFSIPARSYALAARLLADAVDEAGADGLLQAAAEREGERQGRAEPPPADGSPADLDTAAAALERRGYEPVRDGERLWLRNCPFHELSRDNPPVVCGMNLALLKGLVRGLAGPVLEARMEPGPDRCCVVISKSNIG
jgi:predicted ArsR family transcriptional regulator